MADLLVRQLQRGEEVAFTRSVMVPFLDPHTEEDLEKPRWQNYLRGVVPARSWVAEDRGHFVGNCTVYTMDVTVPGSGQPGATSPVVPMGGVSAVGVHPTHRRRGILTSMMVEMLRDCASRGEPVAGLIASESVIYGRFGFGIATEAATATVDCRRAAMVIPPRDIDLRLVDAAEASKILPELFDRFRTGRAGEASMRETAWANFFADHPEFHEGASAIMIAAGDEGYVAYRAKWSPTVADDCTLSVAGLWGVDAEAEAALWRYLISVDLADRVEVPRRALDDPLRWRLADPRQLHLDQVEDRLHLRVLDVAAAFTARGYSSSGRLVLDVVAPSGGSFPGDPVPGRWVLDVGPDGAAVTRARAADSADLRLDVTALGSLYMGGFAASALAAAGRIDELAPGALRVADRVLLTRPLPLTVTGF